MSQTSTYGQTLRAIGQDLEERHLTAFALEMRDGDYVVRAKAGDSPRTGIRSGLFNKARFQALLEVLGIRQTQSGDLSAAEASDKFVELRYGAEEIDRLEREGRSRRGNSTGVPELLSLSQILRAVGAYIDEKRGRLLTVTRRDQSGDIHSVTVEYENYKGERTEEERPFSNIYDLNVHFYKRRKRASVQIL